MKRFSFCLFILFFGSLCYAKSNINVKGFIHSRLEISRGVNDSFSVKRARAGFSNSYKDFYFKVQVDAMDSPILLDAYIKYFLDDNFNLKVGQFKVPLSSELLVSSTKQDLINKYKFISDMLPIDSRDVGILCEKNNKKNKFYIGLFNGNGLNKTNDDDNFLYAGRIEFNAVSGFKFAFSSCFSHEFLNGNSLIEQSFSSSYRKSLFQGDFSVQKKKMLLKGEFIFGNYNIDNAGSLKADGFGITCSYFLSDKKLAVLFRFETYDPDKSVTDKNDIRWITLGVNYTPLKKVKLQVNYIFKEEEKSEVDNNSFIMQLQYCF